MRSRSLFPVSWGAWMGAENLHRLSRGGDKSLDKTDRMSVFSTVTSVWEMPGLDPAMPETSGLLPEHFRLDLRMFKTGY